MSRAAAIGIGAGALVLAGGVGIWLYARSKREAQAREYQRALAQARMTGKPPPAPPEAGFLPLVNLMLSTDWGAKKVDSSTSYTVASRDSSVIAGQPPAKVMYYDAGGGYETEWKGLGLVGHYVLG